MRKLYIKSDCLGSQKAENLFKDRNFTFKKVNVSYQPIDEKDLLEMANLCPNGLKDVINPNSKVLKDLNLEKEYLNFSKIQLVDLIMKHPFVLSFPIVMQDNPNKKPKRLIVGFNEKEWVDRLYSEPNVSTYYNNLSQNYNYDTCCFFDKVDEDETETFIGEN